MTIKSYQNPPSDAAMTQLCLVVEDNVETLLATYFWISFCLWETLPLTSCKPAKIRIVIDHEKFNL